MLIEAISTLLHDYSYLILLLSVGLLGFSAGLRSPFIFWKPKRVREKVWIAKHAERSRSGKQLGSRGRLERGKREELRMMNTSGGDNGIVAMQREKMQIPMRKEKKEPSNEGSGLKERVAQGSRSSRPVWRGSGSLGQRGRRDDSTIEERDSNPGPARESEERSVQRKASLTGEEVKQLADAYIERVRQAMRAQRQDSLKRRPQTPYEAPPPP